MREWIEAGPPGSFDNCETAEDVLKRMVEEEGLEAAISTTEYMLEGLHRIAAERAKAVN